MLGVKFNRLTVIGFSHKEKIANYKGYHHYWKFMCDCGKTHIARLNAVKCGQTKSCGCLNTELVKKHATTHGMSKTRFYSKWEGIMARCTNPLAAKYNIYGGMGIRVLWDSFEHFRDEMYKSYLEHVHEYGEKQTTIDRIDSNGHYCLANCRWATYKEQNNNTSRNRHP